MPFTIEKETWVFISYAFDYANDTTQLYVNYQKDGEDFFVKQKFEASFPDFELKQFLMLSVGCFPLKGDYSITRQNCMQGKAQQFSYVLDYFENPEFLFLIDSDFQVPQTYTFDIYDYDQQKKLIFAKSGPEQALISQGNLQFINKEFVERGTIQFLMEDVELFN